METSEQRYAEAIRFVSGELARRAVGSSKERESLAREVVDGLVAYGGTRGTEPSFFR